MNASLLAKLKEKMREKEQGKRKGKEGFINTKGGKEVDKGKFVTTFRMIPTSKDPDLNDPLKEVHLHYNLGVAAFICPKKTYGKPCATCDTCSELWDTVKEDGIKKGELMYELAKKCFPQSRFFSPGVTITDGKVNDKAEWYGYSSEKQGLFLDWMMNPVIGDLSDRTKGRNVIITYQSPERSGKTYGLVTQELDPVGVTELCDKKKFDDLVENLPPLSSLVDEISNEEIRKVTGAFLERHVTSSTTKYEKKDDASETDTEKKEKDTETDEVEKAFADLVKE